MTNIENQICEAIELIVNKQINEAHYDKTIQGVIQTCEDATIGKYKIKYQDSAFYAYSSNIDLAYNPGTLVYIHIPANDMTQDKIILGTVDKLGVDFIPQIEGDNGYDIIGNNCIESKNTFQLSSYFKPNSSNTYTRVISYYDPKDKTYKGDLALNILGLSEYLKQSSILICGGYVKTALKSEQQYQGNYGIVFGLDFFDNATKKSVTRYYTIDINNMTGNPYKLIESTRQFGIFTIDGTNFDKISSISLFVKDFPNQKENDIIEEQKLFDINIENLEIFGANPMTEKELNTCGISFLTPRGTFFSSADGQKPLPIIAQVKVKGKLLNPNAQKIPFYWFQEDASININSINYNQYGGRGWKCLNNKNILSTEEVHPQVEWIPHNNTYNVNQKDIYAREVKFKCVLIYNNTIYTKTIIIKNLGNTPKITVESDNGTLFYYDMGHPTLTCKINNNEELDEEYTYYWGKEDIYGNFIKLPENEDENNEKYKAYQAAQKKLNDLLEAIKNGTRYENEAKNDLVKAKQEVAQFDKVQRIYRNKIEKVAINSITQSAIYKCSVFKKDNYIGTGSIRLSNNLEMRDGYRLIINNGIQNFQYDEYGMGPTCISLNTPQKIPALTFTILDNLGRPIEEDALKALKEHDITWKIPCKNSMLLPGLTKSENQEQDENKDFYIYHDTLDLSYSIQKKFYHNFKNNNIELVVNYKGVRLTATTDFTFVKMGESGTNGTEYTCKIVPNNNDNMSISPMLTAYEDDLFSTFNFSFGEAGENIIDNGQVPKDIRYAPFKVKVFKSGEEIFSNTKSGNATDDEQLIIDISWSFLRNKYRQDVYDSGYLTINEKNGIMYYSKDNMQYKEKNSKTGKYEYKRDNSQQLAHILKCSVNIHHIKNGEALNNNDNIQLFATLPIIFINIKNRDYQLRLKSGSGFQSVLYTNDGVAPKYDNTNPFEIEVYRNIKLSEDNKSSLEFVNKIDNLQFEWNTRGRVLDYRTIKNENFSWIDSQDLKEDFSDSEESIKDNKYQHRYKPANNYNGMCVTNAVFCTCKDKNLNEIGSIHIPVHMLLNKYGLANLNKWDGNSIQVDKEGGFILSPQIGAGINEEDNSFTGMLMGEVQQPNRTSSDIGLLGYHKGTQTVKIDSQTGAALFGTRQGQIIIDPSAEESMLYGGKYWKEYNEQGLPKNYQESNIQRPPKNANKEEREKYKGMLINLTNPAIDFASGNFNLNSAGKLTAQNGEFQDGCLFKGEINTLKSANIGRNIILDFDSKSRAAWSQITLKDTKSAGYPYVQMQEGTTKEIFDIDPPEDLEDNNPSEKKEKPLQPVDVNYRAIRLGFRENERFHNGEPEYPQLIISDSRSSAANGFKQGVFLNVPKYNGEISLSSGAWDPESPAYKLIQINSHAITLRHSNINLDGTVNLTGALSLSNSLTVNGKTSLNGGLIVNNTTSLNGGLTVSNGLVANGGLTVNSNGLKVNGGLIVNGPIYSSGSKGITITNKPVKSISVTNGIVTGVA